METQDKPEVVHTEERKARAYIYKLLIDLARKEKAKKNETQESTSAESTSG